MDNGQVYISKFASRPMDNGPIKDFDRYIRKPTWTIRNAVDLLTTFRAEEMHIESDKFASMEDIWNSIKEILDDYLNSYEYKARTFLISANSFEAPEGSNYYMSDDHESELYPDSFIDWARAMSMYVPDEFYQKLMRAQERFRLGRKSDGAATDAITAKEKRELGMLRREKENFDLAIKATVRAVQYCINEGRRLKRSELYDFMCCGDESISKETFERIMPLLPPEYRKAAGAPSLCKIGDPDEP
jgi:hypothetical protein